MNRTFSFLLSRRAGTFVASLAVAIACLSGSTVWAGGPSDSPLQGIPSGGATTDRFIIKLRDPAADVRTRLPAIASSMGTSLTYVRAMSGGAYVVRASSNVPLATARSMAGQLMFDSNIAYIEPDLKMYPMLVPNDTMYGSQWNYYEAAGGIDMPGAWDITTGSPSVVVAVIDTGYRPHADLAGRLLPGYDFIDDVAVSNDGDGRDPDASDPGDFGCGGTGNSSWHGTHVMGTIGAASNNGYGVAGINWVSKILPVRVLGRCGGYTSDIADAMRWAAGISVPGVPANPTPARVENLSLGDANACSSTFQSAIDDVVARGTVVVVAAGNSNADAAGFEPAGCNNVIAVAATTRNGAKTAFTNFGSKVAIAAPGEAILSTLNAGTTVPGADSYAYYSGTSMASPHVAGVASLLLSQNPALTPAQVKQRLQLTARPFPTGTGSDCSTALCGAGIVDAAAALAPPSSPPGTRVNLAAQANGGVASASTTYNSGFPAGGANNGDRRGLNWESGGGWNDATPNAYPDWIRIDFPGAQPLTEIDVFTIQDSYKSPADPTEAMTFSQYGVTAFDVQYWNGAAWVTVPGGSVTGNNKVWNKFTFAPITTTSIRVQVNAALAGFSRIVEIEAYKDAPPVNAARPANGGSVSASSTYSSGFPASAAIDGDRRGLGWESGGGWNDGTANSFPDALQVSFDAVKSINEIDVFTLQDNYRSPVEPTESMTFSLYGITDFDVQYWNGSTWVTVPGGTVSGNNKVWRKFSFTPVSTTAIRVNVRNAPASFSRITEVEAWIAQ